MNHAGTTSDIPLRKWWAIVVGCAVACAAFRVAALVGLGADPRVADPVLDGKYYMELAARLAGGQEWPPGPIFMTPLYPWLLGLLFRVASASPLTVQVLQASLGLLTFVVLTATARRDLGPAAALGVAVLYTLCGPLLAIESQVLTETLLLLLTSLALWLWPRPGLPWWRQGSFGLVCGLLAMGRGVFLLVPALAVLQLVASHLRRPTPAEAPARPGRGKPSRRGKGPAGEPTPGRRLLDGLAVLGGLGLALAPLAIRQTRSVGSLQVSTLNGGMNFYIGNNPSADGIYSLPPEMDLESDFTAPRAASRLAGRPLSLPESSAFWRARALGYLFEHPGRWVSLWGKKALLFLTPRELPQIEDYQILRERHWPLRLAFVGFGFVLPLAVLGGVLRLQPWLRSRRESARTEDDPDLERARRLGPWLLIVAVGWLATILFFATGRFRMPFLAGFLGLAGVGLAELVQIIRYSRLRPALVALPLTLGVQALLPSYPVDQARAYDHDQAGLRLSLAGNPSAALEEYRAATRIDPADGRAWHGMGAALVRLNRMAEAVQAYREAIERIPHASLTHYNLGIVHGRMGRPDLAAVELAEAARLDPFDVRIRSDLAVALANAGREAEATAVAREVLRQSPGFAPALRLLRELQAAP